jgi:alkylation response protein AidB-like acyl-CoA dehydrogenase
VDFSLSAEQRELRAAAVAFARQELDQDVAKREAAGEFSPEAWRACAKFGVQGMSVPPELGGGRRCVVNGPRHGGTGLRVSR